MGWRFVLVCVLAVVIWGSVVDGLPGPEDCDPNTDYRTLARNVKPYPGWKHEWVQGTYYLARWYLQPSKTVSDEVYDYASTGRFQQDDPNKTDWDIFYRLKTKKYCEESTRGVQTRLAHGVYHYSWLGASDVMTYIYGNEMFTVEVYCHGATGLHDNCTEYSAMFWSRCPKARPQDIAKGVRMLEEACYPHMKRFLDGIHQKDCTDGGPDICKNLMKCKRRGKDGEEGHGDCGRKRRCGDDDDDDDDDDRDRRRCRGGRRHCDDDDDDDDNRDMRGCRGGRRHCDDDDDDDDDRRRGRDRYDDHHHY